MSDPPVLAADGVHVAYGSREALTDLNLEITRGTVTALVGPNGSGKSTLLRALGRLLKTTRGTVLLDGEAIARLPTREVARRLAMLPQGPSAPGGLTVVELVEQGRYPHAGPLRMLRRQDHDAITEAMSLTGMTAFANRAIDSLSGGERQRAWIALTLAQSAPVLVLDEPTTFLDIRYQLEVLELVQSLNRRQGLTVAMAVHDLQHAARYADRIVALCDGRIVADGPPPAVLTTKLLETVFGVHASILIDPVTGAPVAIPHAIVGTQGQRDLPGSS